MAVGAHKITAEFEQLLCDYTGAPYVVALDNMSNALFLALYYEINVKETPSFGWTFGDKVIAIPTHTYPSVPCEIIHAGGKVKFIDSEKLGGYLEGAQDSRYLTGPYRLWPTNVVDSALRFTSDMYVWGSHMCLSFTGPYKHLKLGKGGAILTDSEEAYNWFKRARFSGRHEESYHTDDLDDDPVIGWNFYMMPEIAAKGILLMGQFYDATGKPIHNVDLELPYPNLSKFKCYADIS